VRIGYQRVVGGSDFLAQPCVDGLVASEERTQAVADDLTLAGVSTRSHPLTQSIGHLVGKRDAQLPRRPHDQPPILDRTPSYSHRAPVLDAQCQWEALTLVSQSVLCGRNVGAGMELTPREIVTGPIQLSFSL